MTDVPQERGTLFDMALRTTFLAALFLALTIAAPASAAVECSYDAATRTVSAVAVPPSPPMQVNGIFKDAEGNLVDGVRKGASPCGGATVTNTDTILVDSSQEGVSDPAFFQIAGDLAPGFTDEPGSSDEIEIVAEFRGAAEPPSGLIVSPSSTPAADEQLPVSVGLGSIGGSNVINLNPAETDGIDPDVMLVRPDGVHVSSFNRRGLQVIADGSAPGTGGAPFRAPISVHGATRADLFIGGLGNDYFFGNGGKDLASGGAGDDDLSGGDGADIALGGAGRDIVLGFNGSDLIRGGSGDDRFLSGDDGGDVVRGGSGDDDIVDGDRRDDVIGGGTGWDHCRAYSREARIRGCEEIHIAPY